MTIRRKAIFISFLLLLMVVVAGCGPSFTEALKKGEDIPAGKVLAVGKIVLEPPFETMGKKKADDDPLEIQVGLTFDRSEQIKEGALYSPNEAISPAVNETFFFPLPQGTRYIRSGQVLKVIGHHINGPAAGTPIYEVLRLYKDVKLEIPGKAQVVYIGTIVYHHDGKRATSVSVRDEYENAVRELTKMKIAGLKGNGMVKKLAVVAK
jgi:hypothetical protein